MVWNSHLFKKVPQLVVIHTVKSFGIVSKAEVDVFLELSCFFDDPTDVEHLISGSSAFLKSRDDPEGWNGEGGGKRVQDGEHMYTCGGFILANLIQLCKV